METGFRGLSTAAGAMVLVIIAAIAVFLISKAVPALQRQHRELPDLQGLVPERRRAAVRHRGAGLRHRAHVGHRADRRGARSPSASRCSSRTTRRKRLATPLGFVIDLLAAVPSVVFGLWGRDVFLDPVQDFSVWLNEYFGWIPLFGGDGPFGRSILLGSLVLAIMVLPIVTSLSREVFLQTPRHERGGGARPRRHQVGDDPDRGAAVRQARRHRRGHARPGPRARRDDRPGADPGHRLQHLASTSSRTAATRIAANIANTFGEANATGRGALIASGLVLFAITLVVNMAARAIIYRRREFRDSAA